MPPAKQGAWWACIVPQPELFTSHSALSPNGLPNHEQCAPNSVKMQLSLTLLFLVSQAFLNLGWGMGNILGESSPCHPCALTISIQVTMAARALCVMSASCKNVSCVCTLLRGTLCLSEPCECMQAP